jgi:amidase
MNDIFRMTALEQARLLRARSISSVELTRAYLERIDRLNPALAAFVVVGEELALRYAKQADARLKRGDSPAETFLGVPTAIKDLHPTREWWTHFGSRSMAMPPLRDCHSAASLRAAGFVFVGKTAASEFGALPVTEPDGRPPTRNPWNLAFTSGGSSGGAGAAVAAGMLPIAHGSDGGGSVRIPSSVCHLFGFKPSRWLLPNAYDKVDPKVLYTCGPLARSVADAAAMTDAMTASTAQEKHRFRLPSLLAALDAPAPSALRIRMILNNPVRNADPEQAEAVRNVAKVLESLGHRVEAFEAPGARMEDFIPIWGRVIGEMPAPLSWRLQAPTKWIREMGKTKTLDEIARVERELVQMLLGINEQTDILLSPTVPIAPLRVGETKTLSAEATFHKIAPMAAFTAPHNLVGQPAANVPAGLSKDGLPLGVQIAAPHGKDALVLQLCKQLEEAMPWRSQWAPASGLG